MRKNEKTTREIQLEELDLLLDFSIDAFDAGVMQRIEECEAERVRFVIPETSALGRVRRVVSTRQYQAEIARLPQMDRATEFRMARRFEFFRLRANRALLAAGFSEDQVGELAQRSYSDLPSSPNPDADRCVLRALGDLSRIRNLFLEGGLHLVLSTAYRYRNLGVDLVDLIQEGNTSLFQAIQGFDWRRDVRFRTYAQFWVHQAVLKSLYNSSRTVRIPVWVQKALRKAQRLEEAALSPLPREAIAAHLDMPVERLEELTRLRRSTVSLDVPSAESEDTLAQQLPDDRVEGITPQHAEELQVRIEEVLDDLPARERAILSRRYGLRGAEPETLAEIADDLGISAERVRQLQNAALKRLRKPLVRGRLADLTT